MAMTIARYPFVRKREGLAFEAQPAIEPGKIRDLATCRRVDNGDKVVLLGPTGVGKTHLEVAPGREAVARGDTLQFTEVKCLDVLQRVIVISLASCANINLIKSCKRLLRCLGELQ